MSGALASDGMWSWAEERAVPDPGHRVVDTEPLSLLECAAYRAEDDDRRDRRMACMRATPREPSASLPARDIDGTRFNRAHYLGRSRIFRALVAMSFNPSTRDLETIALMTHAKATTAQIAAAVGVELDEFRAWCQRLAAARDFGMPVMPAKAPAKEPPAPVSFAEVAALRSKIIADRLFEGEGSG